MILASDQVNVFKGENMNGLIDVGFMVLLIGVGATAVMDLWLLVLKTLNVPTLNFALLGRWVGHVFHGNWFHAGIAKSNPIKQELWIGWLAHYAIGICFAALLVTIGGAAWITEPTFMLALATGVATVIAPLFIMQPAMGSGIASSLTATPLRNCFKSIINHAVFGCGLYLTATLIGSH